MLLHAASSQRFVSRPLLSSAARLVVEQNLPFVAEVAVLAADTGGEHAAPSRTAVAADIAVDAEAYSPICCTILMLVSCSNYYFWEKKTARTYQGRFDRGYRVRKQRQPTTGFPRTVYSMHSSFEINCGYKLSVVLYYGFTSNPKDGSDQKTSCHSGHALFYMAEGCTLFMKISCQGHLALSPMSRCVSWDLFRFLTRAIEELEGFMHAFGCMGKDIPRGTLAPSPTNDFMISSR
jgi:hypothetical protein